MKKLYGVIGNLIGYFMLFDIYNVLLKDFSLDGYYYVFKVEEDDLEDVVKGIRVFGVYGINVIVLYKVFIMDYLDYIDDSVKVIGVVNMVRREGDKFVGYNIDGEGFVKLLMKVLDKFIFELLFLMIGVGGVVRVIFIIIVCNVLKKFDICNWMLEKVKQFIEFIFLFYNKEVLSIKEVEEWFKQYDVIIYIMFVGMYLNVDEVLILLQCVVSSVVVCDIVYNLIQMVFLKEVN